MMRITRLLRWTIPWAMLVVVPSCGPEREPIVDIESVKEAYCEKTVACTDDPEVDFAFCMKRLEEYGVEHGGYYDEHGCLDEQAEFLECLTGMTCEDLYWTRYSDVGGPCYDKLEAVYDADCDAVTG